MALSTTFIYVMHNIHLNKTINITCFRCMLVWAIGTILTRLAVCTWGTYILFLEGNLNLIYVQIMKCNKFYRYNYCQSIVINLNFLKFKVLPQQLTQQQQHQDHLLIMKEDLQFQYGYCGLL